LLFARGQAQEALKALATAIELQPRTATHYVWRAAVYIELGETTLAMKDLDLAVQLEPTEVPLFWRGLLYLAMAQPLKALYDLRASLKEASAKPTGPPAEAQSAHAQHPPARILFWLAVSNRLNGDEEEAARLFTRCWAAAQTEHKATRHTEPAKMSVLLDGDALEAKSLYRHFLNGFNSADAPKTELSHLDLLARLFPGHSAITEIRPWLAEQLKFHTGETDKAGSAGSSRVHALRLSKGC